MSLHEFIKTNITGTFKIFKNTFFAPEINNKEAAIVQKRSIIKTASFYFGILFLLIILAWSWNGAELKFTELIFNSKNILIVLEGFFPPDFHAWPVHLSEMIITIQIAIWGTFLAVIFSIPFGVLSAANISPIWIRQPVRRLMDIFRSVNEMVFALIFVAAVGLGPFAGVLALFIHTLGTLSKLFSEAIENIDPQPVEGIRATGAGKVDEIIYGVLPQVTPLWISYSLYRFEANVRSATVLGIVGAGGIGLILWDAIRSFNYSESMAMLIVIIITVSLLDLASAKLRKIFT